MAINIQILTAANQDLLNNIGDEVFDHDILPDQLRAFLDDPRHVMCLATDTEMVVGMASAIEYFHPDKEPQLFINEVGVASTHRCRGIGRELIEKLIDIGEDRGCVYVWLGTDMDNLPAQACFKAVPEGENPQTFLLYEWDLED